MAEDAENKPANTEIESSSVDEVILSSIKKFLTISLTLFGKYCIKFKILSIFIISRKFTILIKAIRKGNIDSIKKNARPAP